MLMKHGGLKYGQIIFLGLVFFCRCSCVLSAFVPSATSLTLFSTSRHFMVWQEVFIVKTAARTTLEMRTRFENTERHVVLKQQQIY